MKKKETMTLPEATKNLSELYEKMRVIKFGMAGAKTKNVKEQGNVRREIARTKTAITAMNASAKK